MNNEGNFNNQNVNNQGTYNQSNNYNGNMNYQGNNQNQVNYPDDSKRMDSPKKSYCPLLILFMVISLLLAGFIVYDKAFKKEEKPVQQCPTNENKENNINKNETNNEEKLDPGTEVFYDIATNQKYYLVTTTIQSGGDIYDRTEHKILDQNKNEFATVLELSASHIWLESGESLLGSGISVSTTAILKNNKIYSLANSSDNTCDFVQYETFIENGELKQNVVDVYPDSDIGIKYQVSGEKC